ncbi:penicillin-binding protein 2 [Luteimonas sp. M1R5S18]|uniref:Peptidoglycan D,D-transpeptidase MrdA n=1 Tax=Luteimonas rhizosphaericola TaxID=3042024 RepID=A0ABT6JIG4_9GAMM|nr:penicillin-binding protein 2 [Luteimonas rhizosphaericola]MDH5830469.1 penicillin-binding protein 2 [Luteimonas rhizosphaericola]
MRARRQRIRNPAAEAAQFRLRAFVGFVLVALALAGLAAWYFRLQVVHHDDYARQSEANRIKPRPVVPARGLIYDRKGRLLADNVPAFRIDVTPEDAGDIPRMLAALSQVVALSPEEIARFEAARKATRSFRAITLKQRLSDEEVARFAVDRWRFPGVEVVAYLNRRYLHADLLAHVIGYVGRTDESDVERYGPDQVLFPHTGRTGVERYYDAQLRGRVGYEQVETNVEGRALRSIGMVPAQAGTDLRLGIDLDLQRAMVLAFGEQTGSAIAMDPSSGEILAMVSLPSFDPNLFVNGISSADYRRLMDDPSRPLFNRLVLGGVAPGSTLKPLIALAGLDSGLRRPEDRVLSTGMFYLPGTRRGWGDASRGGHGWTDLRKSISASVNTYYYRLALDLGIERFDQYMAHYGFGSPTGIDLAGEIGGILPSPATKLASRRERWYPGDTVNVAIGQGDWKVTALQLVRATAGLAEGSLRRPHLVAQSRAGFEAPWSQLPQPAPVPVSPNPANVEVVRLGMADTMQPGGTGWRVAVGAPYTMAGKTGTAQVISRRGTAAVDPRSLPMHLRHRALFVGFAPVELPTIAVAIAVEGGGYGGSAAAPIARKIFDAWLLGKMPVPEGQEGIAPPDFGNVITGSGPAAAAGGALSAPPGIGPAVQMGGDGPPAAAPPGRSIAHTPAPTDPDVPPPLRPDAGRRSP